MEINCSRGITWIGSDRPARRGTYLGQSGRGATHSLCKRPYVDELGRIYFTDSSAIPPVYDKRTGWWSTMKAALFDILSGYPSGRFLQYDPQLGTTRVLLRSIAYANGVAVDKSGAFVLVAETGRYAVRQYWLQGDQGTKILPLLLFCPCIDTVEVSWIMELFIAGLACVA